MSTRRAQASMLTRRPAPARAKWIERHLARLPLYAWIVFAWSGYAIDMSPAGRIDRSGHIKGHDFAHFYTLGQIALDRRGDELYSLPAQAARLDRLVPQYEDRFVPAHSPQVSILFAPVAWLGYGAALAVWLAISAAVYGGSCYALWRICPALRGRGRIVLLLCAGYPAFFATIAAGQTSAFALGWFVLAYFAMRARRPWLVGLALGSLVYKPTLAFALPFVFVSEREWKTIAAAGLAAGLQLGVVVWYYGTGAVSTYSRNLVTVARLASVMEPDPTQLHSLRALFTLLAPSPRVALVAYAITAVLAVGCAVKIWRATTHLELKYCAALVATVLVDPHLYWHDSLVLAPALFLTADWAMQQRRLSPTLVAILCGCYALPVATGLTRTTHIQLSVVALGALLWWIAVVAAIPAPGRDGAARGAQARREPTSLSW